MSSTSSIFYKKKALKIIEEIEEVEDILLLPVSKKLLSPIYPISKKRKIQK